MAHVFLSYARENSSDARRIARALESAGHDVWWDQHLDSGEEFSAEIEAALEKSEVVVVAWSALSVKSRWVRDEAAVGGDRGRLVPVSIDGTLPPMGFRQFHTLDLAGWKGGKRDERTAELLHSVERKLTEKTQESVPPRTKPSRQPELITNRRLSTIAAALALVLAAGGLYLLIKSRIGSSPSASQPTLALLPFTAASSDPKLRDLAVAARDAVAHAFSDSGVPLKLIDSVPGPGVKQPADYFISAALSADPGKMVATVRMEDSAQHMTVWTREVDTDLKDEAELPDRVGAQVAGSLTWSGGVRSLDSRKPELTAGLLQQDITRDALQNYENAVRLASRYPDSGMAQLGQAMYTAFALDELPREQRAQAVAAGRQAATRARSLIPGFGDVYIPPCVLRPSVEYADCENSLRAGLKADPDAPFVNGFMSYMLNDVGRKQEAFDRASLSYQHDPYMPAKISQMIRMMEIDGDTREADSLYLQGVRWWPDWPLFRARISGILERGDFDALRAVEQEPGAGDYGKPHKNIGAIVAALKARSVPDLRRTCADAKDYFYAFPCMLAFARIGDLDSAYALANQLYPREKGRTPAEDEQLWLDNPGTTRVEFITSAAAEPMRRDPRFIDLAQRTGLLDYWRRGRPPDFCRKHPEPICTQLLKRS